MLSERDTMAVLSFAKKDFTLLRVVVLAFALSLIVCALPFAAYAQEAGKMSIKDAEVVPESKTYVFTGDVIEPPVTVKIDGKPLNPAKDYDVTYSTSKNIGTKNIKVTGTGDYAGTAWGKFTITKGPLSDKDITVKEKIAYTGDLITPAPKVTYNGHTLRAERDYTVAYKANKNIGTARLIVKGKGNYMGTATASFQIVKASIAKATVDKMGSKKYTGKSIKPSPKVSFNGMDLKEGRDYALSYRSNKNVGTAKVTITGKGRFEGKKKVTFKITRASLSKATISKVGSQTYTGSAIKPIPKVTFNGKTLKKGKDYKLSYENNTKVGAAKVTVKGKGNFKGSSTQTFAIMQRSLVNPRASVSFISDQTYTGSPIKPKPTVRSGGRTLKEGTDYKLSYSNNLRVGTAIVYIEGRGGYAGRIAETFQII